MSDTSAGLSQIEFEVHEEPPHGWVAHCHQCTVLPPLPSTPLDQNPVCPACGGTLALERHRVVCLSDEVNHYWYWDGSDD